MTLWCQYFLLEIGPYLSDDFVGRGAWELYSFYKEIFCG